MNQMPSPSAVSATALPSGRVVSVGDCLTRREAQDLLFVQQGETPLRPVAQARNRYVLVGECVEPSMLLASMFAGEPPLTIGEPQAISLEERWASYLDDVLVIPVPVGGGRFVEVEELTASLDQYCAFFEQQRRWEEAIEEALRRAAGSPRGIA